MGNMVVVAIRHTDLPKAAELEFDVLDSMMHEGEFGAPKYYDGRTCVSHREEMFNGVAIASHYYHASDNVNLLVSGSMLSSLPTYVSVDTINTKTINQNLAKQMADTFRWNGRRNSTTRKLRKLAGPDVNQPSYSLFGILTDTLSDIRKSTAMKAMVEAIANMPWIENGDQVSASSYENPVIDKGCRTQVCAIGNFKGDQLALLSLYGNVFNATAIADKGLDYASLDDLIESEKSNPENAGKSYLKIDYVPAILKGIGYEVIEKPEPEMTK